MVQGEAPGTSDLLAFVLAAHGGLERWNSFTSLRARVKQGGIIWAVKQRAGILDDATVTVALREEWASHTPFGRPGRRSTFTSDRVAILEADNSVVEELIDPRRSFAGHSLETPWSDAQTAYVAGYVAWTYFNMPFLLAYPGVSTIEIEPWHDSAVTWRRLQATFPETAPTHSCLQTIYIDPNGLVARHDYEVDIAGGALAAQFTSGYVEVSGIMIPTQRRTYPRRPDGHIIPEPLIASFEISDIALE